MKDFNFDGYKMIVQCREKDLVEWLGRQIPKLYGEENCFITSDYIFAKGKCPVLLCAHMDTVFVTPPVTILYDREQELIWSPEGIGGDDRNGIYSIVHILSKRDKDNLPSVLFTTQEEVGCQGARKATMPLKSKISDINFAIQIDRKGSNDAVFYQCKNRKFIDYICSFGYKEVGGSRTDICEFCPEWDIAGVNFSCGYVDNHTKSEIVNVKNMFQTIEMIQRILDDAPNTSRFEYGKKTTECSSWNTSYYGKYGHTLSNWNSKKEDKKKEKNNPVERKNIYGEPPENDDELIKLIFGLSHIEDDIDETLDTVMKKYGEENVRDPFYANGN